MYHCVRSSNSPMNNRSVEIESTVSIIAHTIPEINVIQRAYIFTELIIGKHHPFQFIPSSITR